MSDDEKKKVLPKPVDWDELYPNRFLKAVEFKGNRYTLTIVDVILEELEGDKGPQVKGIVAFKETEKQLALNKTNGICLKAMFGRKLADWRGRRVTLFPSEHKGEPCIRVFGSPDIPETMQIEIKLPRKRPATMTMHKTEVKTKGP